ncbi:MAG: glycosyltransferase family 2 protein [Chloroflexi bacterium]|nr:glycosyltransferase family 2 protein [Chloroflexota bacterium]
MKVIVQIPCYDEADTLPQVLAEIPRQIPGVDVVEVLVVDDGSRDETAAIARLNGADHVVRHRGNRGLAATFRTGIDHCLQLGADVIVNTDGDNQYPQRSIPDLIRPILEGRADIVIGDRGASQLAHFSPVKRRLQAVGSWTVRVASGTSVPDAPSGFRAYSREAALRLNVVTPYSYTLETIIQAGKQRQAIEHIPIESRRSARKSRLMKNIWGYVKASGATIVRSYAMYEPLKVFFYLGAFLMLLGLAGVTRFLYYHVIGLGGHVQSLILSVGILVVAVFVVLIGLVADLVAANRRLIEELLYRVRRLEGDLAESRRRDSAAGDERAMSSDSEPSAASGEARPVAGVGSFGRSPRRDRGDYGN